MVINDTGYDKDIIDNENFTLESNGDNSENEDSLENHHEETIESNKDKNALQVTVHPLNVNILMERIRGILLFIDMCLLMESGNPSSWCAGRFFSMKVECSFNPCVTILILYTRPFPLLCSCMNPHQRWTMHPSLVDMTVGSFSCGRPILNFIWPPSCPQDALVLSLGPYPAAPSHPYEWFS